MCGLCGVLDPSGRDARPAVARMLDVLKHRGPDATATWAEGPVTIGHHRLSIIDLSDGGAQPMLDADERYVLAYNGEIYNYVELRAELERAGMTFRSTSDSEVLLAAYIRWGEGALQHLNGMFAFVIYDRRRQELFAARDRLGVKPFVYTWDGTRFAFASEHKSLVAGGFVGGTPSPDAVYEYIARGYTTGGRSFYLGVQALQPGHALRVGAVGLRSWRWWTPDTSPDDSRSHGEWVEAIAATLADAVRIRLRSDVAVGAHLSGGLDSSAIVAAAARHEPTLTTFTGAFVDDAASDERVFSRLVNDAYRLRAHEVEISVDELADHFDRLLWHLDEPIAGPGAFPQLLVCDLAARNKVKVVLGGQGGDELFGGYLRHHVVHYRARLRSGGAAGRAEAALALSRLALREWRRVRRTATRVSDDALDPTLLSAVDPGFREHVRRPPIESPSASELMLWDLEAYLPALLHVEDRTSMAASIESRTPLLDYRLVELVLRIPEHLRFRAGEQKPLLREAVAPWLPWAIVNRRDKRGFPTPLHHWRDRPRLRTLVEELLDAPSTVPVFSPSYLRRAPSLAPSEIWTVLMVKGWVDRTMSGRQALAA